MDCCHLEALRHLEGGHLLWEGPSCGQPYHLPTWSPLSDFAVGCVVFPPHLQLDRKLGAQAALSTVGGDRLCPSSDLWEWR